jgi:hypothetical protein
MISGNNPSLSRPVNLSRMGKFIFFTSLFCVGLTAATSFAEEPEKDAAAWTINELMHGLAQVKESKATFVERKYLSILKTPLEYSGTLAYNAPSHLEKQTLLPKPESMVLDQDNLIVQSGAANRKRTLSLQDYPVIWAFVESFRATLAGDIATLSRFYSVTLEGHPKQWLLILRPLDAKMKSLISEIRISGSLEQISTIETREAGGDYSVMSVQSSQGNS